eukprot:4585344-Alexandrium_andersonii.AAC.1
MVFMTPDILRHVRSFDVGPQGVFDVHSVVTVGLPLGPECTVRTWNKPPALKSFKDPGADGLTVRVEAAFCEVEQVLSEALARGDAD